MAKVLYTAEATVAGGRIAGHGRTSDGALDVDLTVPAEMGGPGGATTISGPSVRTFVIGALLEPAQAQPTSAQ